MMDYGDEHIYMFMVRQVIISTDAGIAFWCSVAVTIRVSS
jgi:hypothetical protein